MWGLGFAKLTSLTLTSLRLMDATLTLHVRWVAARPCPRHNNKQCALLPSGP